MYTKIASWTILLACTNCASPATSYLSELKFSAFTRFAPKIACGILLIREPLLLVPALNVLALSIASLAVLFA